MEEICRVSVNHEAHTLIRALLDQRGRVTFVDARNSTFSDDLLHAVENVLVLRLFLHHVRNQLSFDSLLRSDDKSALTGAGKQAAREIARARSVRKQGFLSLLVCAKADSVFWNRKEQQRAVPAVQSKEALLLHSMPENASHAHGVFIRLQLHDRLDVFGRISDGDFHRTCDAA